MLLKLSKANYQIDNQSISKLNYLFLLKNFSNNLELKDFSQKYVHHLKQDVKRFLNYLLKKHIRKIDELTNEVMCNYLKTLDEYSLASKYNMFSSVRIFLRFAYLYQYTNKDLTLIIPKLRINKRAKIVQTIWTSEEIQKILDSIDKSTKQGKRDYAIIMLMAHLGLRFSDIKRLKFENINWKMSILNFNQHKTKKFINLPLTECVGIAIIDYIKNARPNVNSEYIFLNDKDTEFSDNSDFYQKFRKYLELANIDISNKKYIGPYSLRHTLATTLLQNRTSLSTISGILGHTNINNTLLYLKVDIPSLKECCLELEVH